MCLWGGTLGLQLSDEFGTMHWRAPPGRAVFKSAGPEIVIKRTLIIGSLIAALANMPASAAIATCSIHPAKNATDTQLAKLAKVTQADAEKRALARIKSPAKVVGSELQVEDGCLVWTLIVKEGGKSGMQAMKVDAGTGKMLLTKHESGK